MYSSSQLLQKFGFFFGAPYVRPASNYSSVTRLEVTYFGNCLWVLASPPFPAYATLVVIAAGRLRVGDTFSRSLSLRGEGLALQSCLILCAPIGEICCLSASLLRCDPLVHVLSEDVCGARERCPNPADRRKPQKRNQITKVNQTANLSLQGCVTKGQGESQREEWESEWAWAAWV